MGRPKKGRTTVYNKITSEEKMELVNKQNMALEEDFLKYLSSIDRSPETIAQYKSILHIFWVWNLENNGNKFFVHLTKREVARFQSHALSEWEWSPSRIRTVKATLSSLSNYIENMLDDEYDNYRPIIRKIESPASDTVRIKSVFKLSDLQPLLNRLVKEEEYMKACILALGMYSGRRKAELTRFKASYFDESNLICNGALYKTPEQMKTKGRGKRGKMLDVYILAKPFNPYLYLWLSERERLGITSDWLFPKCVDGKYVDEHIEISTMDSMAQTFSRILDRPLYWHSIRHFFTTYLLEQNLPESIVQTIQGWASSDMVRVYDDRSNDSQLEKYFGADGIKKVESSALEDL